MNAETNRPLEGRRLLIAASGSIAAVKTPILVTSLIKAGAEVRCLVTPSAAQLVSPIALASLSRNRCYQDEDQWSPTEPRPLHIELAEWAELVVVAPLSASSLARWAQGLGEGLLASVLLACEKPSIAAPAMNTGMWEHPAVQSNWKKLNDDPRVLTLPPASGLLACDRFGDGRMANTDLIELAITSELLKKNPQGTIDRDWKGRKLLITAGPTIESLDPARLISNKSSGRMGAMIAQAARFRGAQVDLVHGPLQIPNSFLEGLTSHPVKTSQEMQERLRSLQASADAVIMAAAVSDIRRKGGQASEKKRKDLLIDSLLNSLEPVPDILLELNANKPNKQILLGFAALTGNDEHIQKDGEEKRISKGCDLLFANPIDRTGQGFEVNFNGGWLLGPQGMTIRIPVTYKLALAHELLDAIHDLW